MLNERNEFRLYLCGDRTKMPLRNETTQESLTGIRRPLQVLARGFLEICENEGISAPQSFDACKAFLYGWICGEAHKDHQALALPQTLENECANARNSSFLFYAAEGKTQEEQEKLQNAYREKALEWYRPAYFSGKVTRENTFNQCYFSYIIADALFFGNLRNERLLVKNTYGLTYGLTGTDDDRKVALAMVSQYLQLRRHIPDTTNREYIPIVQGEIANWVNIRPKKNGDKSSVALAISRVRPEWAQELLMEKVTMNCNVKIRIHPGWLETLDVQLVPDSSITEAHKKAYYIFTDKQLMKR